MSVFRRRIVFRDGRQTRVFGGGSLVTGAIDLTAAAIIFAGTASGSTTGTGSTASGAIVFAGGTSTINIEVSGSGPVVFAGTAQGAERNLASASGSIIFAGSARCDALASGSIVFAGSATVGSVFTMDANGAIVFSGTAAAQSGASASGSIVFSGSGGTPVVTGGTVTSGASGAMVFAGTAVGVYGSTNNVPDRFFIPAKFNVLPSTLVTSVTVQIQGNTQPANLLITNGEYSINGGAFATAATLVPVGGTVAVRHTSAATYSTQTTTTLIIGGVTANFVSVTEADPNPHHTNRRHRFIAGHVRHRR